MHYSTRNERAITSTCPLGASEHQRIREKHRTLASTGCTKEFCQAGRAVHTDEPRVGENRSLEVVQQEATEFLRDLFEEGFFQDEEQFKARLQQVLAEILRNSVQGIVRDGKRLGCLGGNWSQTPAELEFGIKLAWRNSRKCIGRNHYRELKLCDLRMVKSSVTMAQELLQNLLKAFNGGRVEPTVFVFPPRVNNSRGPMIMNEQVWDFAGYEREDGTVIGDPANIGLTGAFIELGWKPPQPRGRWDLLPLVTMAEGDKPAIVEIPAPLSQLIPISHPQHPTAFERLDLKWKAAPALTRLGFDIGGVQYTAAPFIGWFVDAEIGLRNLADPFRYNVLPEVIQAMDLTKGRASGHLESFEEYEEYEQLVFLSRAQAELNYAVQWSYKKAGVIMLDSLTASKKWCAFDDDFREKNGYRLPADPYWLALPQGSIIPVWHRGGAPNYQPKPMISRHVQDPVKAWRRELSTRTRDSDYEQVSTMIKDKLALTLEKQESATVRERVEPTNDAYNSVPSPTVAAGQRVIEVYFCSAGTTAEKLAKRLVKRIGMVTKNCPNLILRPWAESLDKLEARDITADKIFLLIVSTTGKGDIPANGSNILRINRSTNTVGMSFAIFGNGDSRYSLTYNGAAQKVHEHMRDLGGRPLFGRVFRGDTAIEPIPFTALSDWGNCIESKLSGDQSHSSSVFSDCSRRTDVSDTSMDYTDNSIELLAEHANQMGLFQEAAVIRTSPSTLQKDQRSVYVCLDLGNSRYDEMNCIQILPINSPDKVDRVLRVLDRNGATTLEFSGLCSLTYAQFLTGCVDLELPFKELTWLNTPYAADSTGLAKDILKHFSALEVLELLLNTSFSSGLRETVSQVNNILLDMSLLHARTYSVASSPRYLAAKEGTSDRGGRNMLDVMVKKIPGGRFSDIFLRDVWNSTSLKYRLVDALAGPKLRQTMAEPIIVVATGAGFGPIRCLLERRIAEARQVAGSGGNPKQLTGRFSIFLGLHTSDVPLAQPILDEAAALGLIEILQIVESNVNKTRVYDRLREGFVAEHLEAKLTKEQALVFVCANEAAAKSTKMAFREILGPKLEAITGERYIEEVF